MTTIVIAIIVIVAIIRERGIRRGKRTATTVKRIIASHLAPSHTSSKCTLHYYRY